MTSIENLQRFYMSSNLVSPPCPCCDRESFESLVQMDRHDLGFSTSMCTHCGLVQINPRPLAPWFDKFYERFFWDVYIGSRFGNFDDMFRGDQCAEKARNIIDHIDHFMQKSCGRYLDIGCGLGGMLSEFHGRYKDWQVEGIDPSRSAVEFIERKFRITARQMSIKALSPSQYQYPFDLVSLVHMLEHSLDPMGVLRCAADLLDERGIIYVEVPNLFSPAWSGKDFLHIAHTFLFDPETLEVIFSKCGLDVIKKIEAPAFPHWPWAFGMLGRRTTAPPLQSEDVPARSDEELNRRRKEIFGKVLNLSKPSPVRRFLSRLKGSFV